MMSQHGAFGLPQSILNVNETSSHLAHGQKYAERVWFPMPSTLMLVLSCRGHLATSSSLEGELSMCLGFPTKLGEELIGYAASPLLRISSKAQCVRNPPHLAGYTTRAKAILLIECRAFSFLISLYLSSVHNLSLFSFCAVPLAIDHHASQVSVS